MQDHLSRRGFLATGGLTAFASVLGTGEADAAVIGDGDEKKNVTIVNAMCDAWGSGDADKVASFFTDDAAFRGGADHLAKERPASVGRDAIRASAASFFKSGKLKMVVEDTFARGSLVVNSHHQLFEMNDPALGKREDWYLGVFFLKDGKIQEWNDYALIPFSQAREQHPSAFGKFIRL